MSAFNNFYRGKTVFLTGHTGFKGGWLATWLVRLGAHVIGYSMNPESSPNMFELLGLSGRTTDIRGDILDFDKLSRTIEEHHPDLVFHLAAQAIVREGYKHPRETFNTNLMGTVNVLEAARRVSSIKSCVVVTTDKVYRNLEWDWAYRENDSLGGHDAYAASKACAELAVAAYQDSRFQRALDPSSDLAIVSVRAGNVIGGGDWSKDRIIVDTVRSIALNQNIRIRNPNAVRPWQHVLDALSGYLWLGSVMNRDRRKYCNAWNFGPSESRMLTVVEIVEHLLKRWPSSQTKIIVEPDPKGCEAQALKLDSARSNNLLDWHPTWDVYQALDSIAEWYQACYCGRDDMFSVTVRQIDRFTRQGMEKMRAWAGNVQTVSPASN